MSMDCTHFNNKKKGDKLIGEFKNEQAIFKFLELIYISTSK